MLKSHFQRTALGVLVLLMSNASAIAQDARLSALANTTFASVTLPNERVLLAPVDFGQAAIGIMSCTDDQQRDETG